MNLAELRGLTRTYLNEPFAAFWSDSELNRLVNIGCQKYHARIKNISRNHFTTRVTFSTVANQEYYQLPTNLKDLRLVSIVDPDREYFIGHAYWPNPDRWAPLGQSCNDTWPRQYWIVGPAMRLVPTPTSILTIRLYYEARQVALASDTEVPTFDLDYHDLASKWAAVEASAKDRQRRPDIEAMLASRESDLIQDVYHRVNPPVYEAEGYLEELYER